MRFLGSEAYPGTVKNALRYMDRFVFFKALGLESNCLKETFKSLLVSFKNRDSADTTMFAVFLPLTVFDFLEFSQDTVCLVHTASNRCRGFLVRGYVLCPPDLWRSCSSNWVFFFTHLGKSLSTGAGQMGVLQKLTNRMNSVLCGLLWRQMRWRPSEVAVEQASLLPANCSRAGKQPDGLSDQILN